MLSNFRTPGIRDQICAGTCNFIYVDIRCSYVKRIIVFKIAMAKNTGNGYRRGSVDNRTQTQNPINGNWTKRDTETGRFIDQKQGGDPFKGVAKEVDNRRD